MPEYPVINSSYGKETCGSSLLDCLSELITHSCAGTQTLSLQWQSVFTHRYADNYRHWVSSISGGRGSDFCVSTCIASSISDGRPSHLRVERRMQFPLHNLTPGLKCVEYSTGNVITAAKMPSEFCCIFNPGVKCMQILVNSCQFFPNLGAGRACDVPGNT